MDNQVIDKNEMSPEEQEAVRALLAWMQDCSVAPYDERTRTGLIRHIMTRTAKDGRTVVTLVSREGTVKWSMLAKEKSWILSNTPVRVL